MANHFTRDEKDMLEDAKKAYQEGTAKEQLKELAKAGDIREAAIVFSREGMELFASMFGNTMETVVSRAIDNRVSAIIEQKMIEMMEGMRVGMKQGMVSMADNLFKGFDLSEKEEQKQIQEQVKFDLVIAEPTEDTVEDLVSVTLENAGVPSAEEYKQNMIDKLNMVFADEPETVEEEIVTVEGSLLDIDERVEKPVSPIESYHTNKKVIERINSVMNNRRTPHEPKPRHVGAKVVELREWAPIFAEYVEENSPRKVPMAEIIKALSQTHNVKFLSPAHITNAMLQLHPEITRPEKGFYKHNAE